MKTRSVIKVIACLSLAVHICHAVVVDATWNAIVGKDVVLKMTDSQMVSVKILAYKDSMLTIVKEDGFIESIESKNVSAVKLDLSNQAQKQDDSNIVTSAPATTSKYTPVDKSLKKENTCGPFLGLGPGIIGFNANVKNVNLFASTSFIFPIASEGEYWTGTIGVGKLIGLGTRGWKFNTFTHLSFFAEQFDEYDYYYGRQSSNTFNLATGVGVGFQYISAKGLLFSFKAPILGFNFCCDGISGFGVVMYYPCSLASMPCIVFGKSF